MAFISQANNLSADDNDALTNVFVRDALAGTTELVSRAPGPAGAAANAFSGGPTTSAHGRYVAFDFPGHQPGGGDARGREQRLPPRRAGRRPPGNAPVQELPLPPAPPDKDDVVFTLSVTQLTINQRISQAAIRRLNAVEVRLNGGLATRDLCGSSVGPAELGPGIASGRAAASLARPRRPTRPGSSTPAARARATASA